jgi:hypothetical protein
MSVASVALASCGGALPSTAPLSVPTSHPMARVRPSSARAPEIESEDHSHIETESPTPSDDDDDSDDSERKSRGIPHDSDAVPE